jgi:transposase
MVRKTRRKFSPEFKREAVARFHASGKSVAVVAQELGLHVNVLRDWVEKLRPPTTPARGESKAIHLTDSERAELQQLRRDKARLEMEVEILGKATAFFANRNR